MPRRKLRSQGDVVERCRTLGDELRSALAQLPAAQETPQVVDTIWHGEALGTLLWALQLTELPPYDEPFDAESVVAVDPEPGELRDGEEIELERDSARLWHWRARTAELQSSGTVELPSRFATFDQLIAATAMRGYEQGVLPPPVRGDFRAFGKVYRHLTPAELTEAHSLAAERHHALNWLCGAGASWYDVPLDT
jgi:hypothetical protein